MNKLINKRTQNYIFKIKQNIQKFFKGEEDKK